MMKFDTSKILPGDILQVRSDHFFGKGIRVVLGSFFNHTAMFVRPTDLHINRLEAAGVLPEGHGVIAGQWCIGEAISPKSTLTTLEDYYAKMNIPLDQDGWCIVGVWRFPNLSATARVRVERYFLDNKLGLKYPIGVFRLWMMRFMNQVPYHIKGNWCSRIVWDAYKYLQDGIWIPMTGKRKRNPTPRTIENRMVAGVLKDVSKEVIVS